jgi:hypothetical protein
MSATTDYGRLHRATPVHGPWKPQPNAPVKSWYAKGVGAQRKHLTGGIADVDADIAALRVQQSSPSRDARLAAAMRRRDRMQEALDRVALRLPPELHRAHGNAANPVRKPTPVVPVHSNSFASVPLPDERRNAASSNPPRPGQFEFRDRVLAAYGACAVTGCAISEALEAAHIVPFVDERSHRMENALCLRADIHALYDCGLIGISADGKVAVDKCVHDSGYQAIHGATIRFPLRSEDRPSAGLLSIHKRFIRGSKP